MHSRENNPPKAADAPADARAPVLWLDLGSRCLRCGERAVALRPKVFTVLRVLLSRPGDLFSAAELRAAGWVQVAVSPGVLKNCIRELRSALATLTGAEPLVETVGRQGYRLRRPIPAIPAPALPSPGSGASQIVGREAELAQLHAWLAQARQGKRQTVFVTGELGIGKTALVQAFTAGLEATQPALVGYGQCVEHYDRGESYLPVMEALERLWRGPEHNRVRAVLRQHAPTWLAHMSSLLTAAERARLRRETLGATGERFLREIATALEHLTATIPLVLVLEDLHWSDASTATLLTYLARRPEPARLFVLGTHRLPQPQLPPHPLHAAIRELVLHQQCRALALGPLPVAAVTHYLQARLPARPALPELARVFHERTGGNPLFLASLAEELLCQDPTTRDAGARLSRSDPSVIAGVVPPTVRHLIERQLEGLTPSEQRVLTAASLAGLEFSTAAVAAACELPLERVEDICEALAQRHLFLRAANRDARPERRRASRYALLYPLHREVLAAVTPVGRRVYTHQRLATWKETAYGPRAWEKAAELAEHFAQGHAHAQAVSYYVRAAETALRRFAYGEARALAQAALEALTYLPEDADRRAQELRALSILGPLLIGTRGYAAPDVEQAYGRAYELSRQVPGSGDLFPTLWGLWAFAFGRGRLKAAAELAQQAHHFVRQRGETALALKAQEMLGLVAFHRGALGRARVHLECGARLYDQQRHQELALTYGQDPGVLCRSYAALTCWMLGDLGAAQRYSTAALALARQLAHPYSRTCALVLAAWYGQLQGSQPEAVRQRAEAAQALATEHGFTQQGGLATCLCGWALARQGQITEGLRVIRDAVTAFRATGAELELPHLLGQQAQVYQQIGEVHAGLDTIAEALAAATGARYYVAELYRLRGELLVQAKRLREAESSFRAAVHLAQRQRARAFALRAAVPLGELLRRQGKKKDARRLLSHLMQGGPPTQGTPEEREARRLLKALA